MSGFVSHRAFDVVVVGAGSAGIAAAIAAARNGAKTALVESGALLGGELLSGMTIDGAINARGERITGGVIDDLLARCRDLGGFVKELNDWRLIRYIAIDPEIMKIAVAQVVYEAGVAVFLHTFGEDVLGKEGRVDGVIVRNKAGRTLLSARIVIDCSGDGDICAAAGTEMLEVAKDEMPQPVSMMFRMAGVEAEPLLAFVQKHPDYFAIGESEEIRGGRTDEEIVKELHRQGQPCVFLKGDGSFLGSAIANGEMYPTALIMVQPTSETRKEVCVNSTRITLRDPRQTSSLSEAFHGLVTQVQRCASFLTRRVPGFEKASISGVAPRIGIRETRRVAGDYILTSDDVRSGRKWATGVAKGCHHIDIHQEGSGQIRIPVANGGSYDIPFECLVPRKLSNVLVAGRCFSAEREAHASARVMGGCLGMGQAAGMAAAMALQQNVDPDVRKIDAGLLRGRLKEQRAIIDGTH